MTSKSAFDGKHADITEQIVEGFSHIYAQLGHGFSEKVYENALAIHLRKRGLTVIQQRPIKVYFEKAIVGDYFADMIVEDKVLIELKAVRQLTKEHEAQLLNYLKATKYEVGMLINFGLKSQIKRKVFDNDKKGSLAWTQKTVQTVKTVS